MHAFFGSKAWLVRDTSVRYKKLEQGRIAAGLRI